MKEKIKKVITGKGFYIVALIGVISAVAAVMLVYRTSKMMLGSIGFNSTTIVSTKQAQNPKNDVLDPRISEQTTTETTTQITTETTTVREESTAIEPLSTTLNEAEVFGNDSYIMPLTGQVLKEYSSEIPVYDETMNDWRVHRALDIMGKQGEEVQSVGNGMVKKVVSDPSYGYIVEVNYGTFTVRYCGLEQGTVLHPETVVKKGDTIGKIGTIPCESEMESHLHIEVMQDEKYINPEDVLLP